MSAGLLTREFQHSARALVSLLLLHLAPNQVLLYLLVRIFWILALSVRAVEVGPRKISTLVLALWAGGDFCANTREDVRRGEPQVGGDMQPPPYPASAASTCS
jgi:hypothetical protein